MSTERKPPRARARRTRHGRPPTGLGRRLFRLPIHVFRIGLGGVFGGRLLLLEHTGRVSGRPRQTVLEVVERSTASYVVASGFGAKADWYRNVLAAPEVTLVVGRTTLPATAHIVPEDEAEVVMVHYARRHPRAARHLCRLVMGFDVDGSTEDFRTVGRSIPFLRFQPRR